MLDLLPRDGAFRAEAFWQQVHASAPHLGRATVFRTLRLLQELDLLERVATADGGHAYQLCAAGQGHHHHLRCVSCGRDEIVAGESLRRLEEALAATQAAYGFTPVEHSLQMSGRCRTCQES